MKLGPVIIKNYIILLMKPLMETTFFSITAFQIVFLYYDLKGSNTHVNNEVSERFEAVRLVFALAELVSVFDDEQSQSLLLLGHFQSEVHLFHLLLAVEQRSQDGHGFGRMVSGVLPYSLHLLDIAIWR